jgi:hypothetical protein
MNGMANALAIEVMHMARGQQSAQPWLPLDLWDVFFVNDVMPDLTHQPRRADANSPTRENLRSSADAIDAAA